jgi:hypothetical protein
MRGTCIRFRILYGTISAALCIALFQSPFDFFPGGSGFVQHISFNKPLSVPHHDLQTGLLCGNNIRQAKNTPSELFRPT